MRARSTCAAFRWRTTRSPHDFGAWSKRVFESTHSVNDELAWLDAEGPTSPALVRHLAGHQTQLRLRAVLQPALLPRVSRRAGGARQGDSRADGRARRGARAGDFQPILRGVRACMYNSPEERALLQAMAGARRRARRGRRRRVGAAGRRQRRALPAADRDPRPDGDLHRPHRREQGLRRAVRLLEALQRDHARRRDARARRHTGAAGARCIRGSVTSVSSATRRSWTRCRPPSS